MNPGPIVSQSELQERVLRALFEDVQDNSDRLNSDEIAALLRGKFSAARVKLALKVLVDSDLVDAAYDSYGASYLISNKGYLTVEESIEVAEPADHEFTEDRSVAWLPASDRMVPLNHNDPEYRAVADKLSEVRDIVRTSNDLGALPEERDIVLLALESASTLWRSTQLSLMQIRVGVLMAAQQAWAILKSNAKALASALLVDAIKSFIKTHCNLDLDAL